jgi:hypothetical protein
MVGVNQALLYHPFGLWWVTVASTLAAAVTLVGAMRGVRAHRVPRLMLGVAVAAIAVSYWWDIFGVSNVADGVDASSGADLRRGAAYVLWPALLWTAWEGISYSLTRDRAVEKALGGEE